MPSLEDIAIMLTRSCLNALVMGDYDKAAVLATELSAFWTEIKELAGVIKESRKIAGDVK